MVNEKDKIVIRNAEGENCTFYKLFQFFHKDTKKHYLIYTDNQKDKDGQLKLYSSIIVDDGQNIQFLPVHDDVDFDIVSRAIVQLKLELM